MYETGSDTWRVTVSLLSLIVFKCEPGTAAGTKWNILCLHTIALKALAFSSLSLL